jgi:aminoglycoside 6'-N-acetyltransferase
MILRPATPDDVPRLNAWDNAAHVIAAVGAEQMVDWRGELARADRDYEILIAEADRPIGVVLVKDPSLEPEAGWGAIGPGSRAITLWIGDEADCGQGLGAQMMRLALARCFAERAVRRIYAAPLGRAMRARMFFARLGFQERERRVFNKRYCVLYRLDKADWAAMRRQPSR